MNRAETYAALIGSPAAGELAAMLGSITEAWDDAVDGAGTDGLSEAFRLALCELPKNAAYQAHPEIVSTLLLHASINWHIANAFEAAGETDGLEIAHVLRYMGASVVAHLAFLDGGMARAVDAGVAAWKMTTKEPVADYIREHVK